VEGVRSVINNLMVDSMNDDLALPSLSSPGSATPVSSKQKPAREKNRTRQASASEKIPDLETEPVPTA